MQKRIDKIFFKDKSIPVDLFLDKILYHKKLGYYQKKNPFGKKGDFVTAPNISNVFSEMIAIWFVSFWENLNRPDRINFVELGPGNGDFSLSLINTLKRFPNLSRATKIYLYERSEKLIGIQKKKINSRKVSWIKNFDRINNGPVIFFGNEFLDALPIKQFKKIKNNIYEKHVSIKNKKIDFILKKASKVNIKKLRNYKLLDEDGITRKCVISIAKSKGVKIIERKIKPEEMSNFVGCFLTGTAAEITPVSQIDNYKFTVCNLIKNLSESYINLVRKKVAA